jgi:uncharacterized membrane protein (UPF0136 family)
VGEEDILYTASGTTATTTCATAVVVVGVLAAAGSRKCIFTILFILLSLSTTLIYVYAQTDFFGLFRI